MELLSAGIDVITAVNIQHLESIADAVEQITGVPIRLVGVTGAPGTDGIVRRASRMAPRIKAELQVLHIVSREGPGDRRISN